MTVNQMRVAIADVYAGPYWRMKCLYDMSDRQVIAIYKDMERTGRLKFAKKKQKLKEKSTYTEPRCEQLSIWDFMKE